MTASARSRPAPALPRILGQIRPRPRWLEVRLLVLVAIVLVVGSASLGATVRGRPDEGADLFDPSVWLPLDVTALAIYLGALFAAHAAQVLAGRRTDQVLLPAVGMLGGISLLLMQRLPQDLVGSGFFGAEGLGQVQLVWLLLSIAVATTVGIVVRSDSWLRQYKYTWAAAGIALLLLTFVFGSDVGGQRLTLVIGPFSGQPSELLKVILVIFLAGYLSENRALLVEQDTRVGPIRLPPIPYLVPMAAMWAIALGIVVVQRDLGAALLFFGVFLLLLYAATARISLVIGGVSLGAARLPDGQRAFGNRGAVVRCDLRKDGSACSLRESQSLLFNALHTIVQRSDQCVVVVSGKCVRENTLVLWTQVRTERISKRLPTISPADPRLKQQTVLAVSEEIGLNTQPLGA